MTATGRRLRVFVSYSHAPVDDELRQLLGAHLANLRRSEQIEFWSDQEITAGREFDPAIAEELERADLILLLVSADFLKSDYCSSIELTAAMKRHEDRSARVVPIILRPCDWKSTPLARLLAAPKNGKPVTEWRSRDRAFYDIVETIRRIVSELTESSGEHSSSTSGLAVVTQVVPQPSNRSCCESQPITRRFVEWRARIHDVRGAKATVWKTTVLVANEANILSLVDRNFASTGQLMFVGASLGDIDGPTDEGGTLSVTTVLREPLPVGREVSNTLTINARNTFTAARETFGHIVTDQCRARVVMELPAKRPAISALAFRVVDGKKEIMPDNVLSADKLQLELEVKDARIGSRYVLEWQW